MYHGLFRNRVVTPSLEYSDTGVTAQTSDPSAVVLPISKRLVLKGVIDSMRPTTRYDANVRLYFVQF